MNRLKLCTLCLILCSCKLLAAQNKDTGKRRFRLSEMALQRGLVYYGSPGGLRDHSCRPLARGSQLLSQYGTGYTDSVWYGPNDYNRINNTSVSIQLGFTPLDAAGQPSTQQLFSIGLSYFKNTAIAGAIYQQSRKTFDTLSKGMANERYIDSVKNQALTIGQDSRQIRLDISHTFKAKISESIHYYIGLGLSAGFSFNNQVFVDYHQYSSIQVRQYIIKWVGPQITKSESLKGRTQTSFAFYFPIGINFGLSRNKLFWKNTSIFLESRQGMNFLHVPRLFNLSYWYMQNAIGVRIQI